MNALVEFAIAAAEFADGREPVFAAMFSGGDRPERTRKIKPPNWTAAEDAFLRENLGYLSEEEMGAFLGRSATAVKLRWKRDLHLAAPSRNPDILTACQAAALLGLDMHQITHWCDAGLIPHRIMPGERRIRLIRKISLWVWVVNPMNWIYFDWRKLADPHLRRLCALRQERWGDEWWSSRQAADYHGVSVDDVKRFIVKKWLDGRQTEVSRSGRYVERAWANWFVRKSDAVRAVFVRGRGQNKSWEPTPRAQAWMMKARFELGWPYGRIAKSMGGKVCAQTIANKIEQLVKQA